jgi:hypothetical protein
VRCISAGDDGAVKVWELTPSGGSGGGKGKKRRRGDSGGVEVVIDVRAVAAASPSSSTSSATGAGEGETSWQRMKRRRTAGLHGRFEEFEVDLVPAKSTAVDGQRPERVKRVLVGTDKIVIIGAGEDGEGGGKGEERVRILRFD